MTEYEKMSKAELIEELRKQDRQFSWAHELVSSSDYAIVGMSLDGTVSRWNKGAENIYGYSAREIIGQNITTLSPPHSHDEVLRILEKIRRGERIRHFETVRVTKEGRRINVSLKISPIINTAGEITGASLIARDISERKRMEEELLLTKFCIDKASITICRTGPEAQILDANEHMCRSLGYTREELTSMSIFDIDATFTLETWKEHRKKVQAAGTRTFETLHRRKDGTTFPVEVTVNYLTFGGKGVGISFARDITERKRMEDELRLAHDELEKRVVERTEQLEKTAEALRTSEERYALAVQGAKDGIWDLNLVTGEIYFSPRWKRMLGYEEDEIPNKLEEWKNRIHPDDRRKVLETRKACLDGLIPAYEIEFRLHHKDGSYRWIHSRGACLRDSEGKAVRFAGSHSDITEKKRLEQQLLHSQKMESVGILAGGVAHDFNNLLTAISGYGQILLERIPEDDDLSQESIKNVLKAADRAAELTRGLLAFSRKQMISPKPVHIDSLISDAGKLIQRVIGEDIEFSVNFSGKNPVVKADPGQIEQVLMNLATNARDAMPNGGRLSITTMQVVVEEGAEKLYDLPVPGGYALISVADTGTGIDGKTLENIFEPFYTTKETGKGTGLGLAIVHGIIKQHNGSILACSEPGKGTTFDIYLPLDKGHAFLEEAKISARHAGGMETLLVVEDDEIVRMFMKKILERAGYKVAVADNGEDAVARFRENEDISLVLSDVVMPRKNGREMLEEIKKIKPGIKVVFVSGYAADIMQRQGMLEEDTEFISKPFKTDELLQKVREVLDRDQDL